MMACILDRCGGLGCQQNRDVLVLLGEHVATGLFGEVEISEHPATSEYRYAQERAHGGMVRRKAGGLGMLGEIGQSYWFGFFNDEPENAAAMWSFPDPRRQLGIDAIGREVLEDFPIWS